MSSSPARSYSLARATERVWAALASGAAVEKFRDIIRNQGGDPSVVDKYARLPTAPDRHVFTALRGGVVASMKAEAVGRAAVGLGAGRDKLDAAIDHAVGFIILAPPGTPVKAGDPVVEIHHRDGRGLNEARQLLEHAIAIEDTAPEMRPPVLHRLQGRI